MIKITKKEMCCACTACAKICPIGCITMKEDEEGFLYPSVDESKCVHCGKCEKVCPILRADEGTPETEGLKPEPDAVGGWNKDEAVREASSSGGAFSLLADKILERGGVIFGAALKDMKVCHIAVTDQTGLALLRGSKYVQSVVGDSYPQVKEYLEQGKEVLFSGTPCQTAGLRSFLGKEYEKLYLVDFICHGVPSPKVFSDYISSVEKKENAEVVDFRFRLKDKGWHPSGLQLGTKVKLSNGKEIRKYPALKDTYMNAFLENLDLRPSCYDCRFKSVPKWGADITIADFWGVSKVMPEMNDKKGTSLLLLNTDKGARLFEEVKDRFHYKDTNWQAATKKNPTLVRPAKRPILRDTFFPELEERGYDKVARKHLSTTTTFFRKGFGILGGKMKQVILKIAGTFAKLLHIKFTEERQQKLIQFLKFCTVGVTNVAVSYLTNICTILLLGKICPGLEYDYVVANVTAFLVAVYWSFIWNSKKVFNFRTKDKALRRRVIFRTYMCYGLSGIVVNNILGTIWIKGLGISKMISPLLNLFVTIPLNFITNKYWAYAPKKEDKPEP